MTITFCQVLFIPQGVRSEHSGFNHFLYSILNYENKLSDMKHYSCSWPIRYNVVILIPLFSGPKK